MTSKLVEKLSDHEYRKAFVSSQISVGIPFQIRALLKARGKTQEWLAEMTGMLQPRISGLMTAGRTRPNIETLRRLAEAFDCGLAVRFVPFSELVRWSTKFDPESFDIPSFENDPGFRESEPIHSSAMRYESVATFNPGPQVRGLGETVRVKSISEPQRLRNVFVSTPPPEPMRWTELPEKAA